MTDRLDCLICGRLWLPSGEPSCDCLTHSLSRPVGPPQHEPDPADVALFPLEEERPRTAAAARRRGAGVERLGVDAPAGAPARPVPSHRKPRYRNRASLAAGGAVAAVVGSAALAASFFNGASRDRAVSDAVPPVPSLVLPDGNGESGEGAATDSDGHAPDPEEGEETAPEGPDGGEPPPDEPEADATGEPPPPDPTPTDRPDPPPSGPGPGPDPTPTQPTPPTPDPEDPEDPDDPEDPGGDPDPGDPDPDPAGSLKEGDEGPEVVELQERLLELRWVYRGTAHGSYDTPTKEAVARLQSAYGVTDDPKGVYGPHTRELLESLTERR